MEKNNILDNNTMSNEQDVIKKWENFGLLYGVKADLARTIALKMEYAAVKLINSTDEYVHNMEIVLFPIIRKVIIGLVEKYSTINVDELDIDVVINKVNEYILIYHELDKEFFNNMGDVEAISAHLMCERLVYFFGETRKK